MQKLFGNFNGTGAAVYVCIGSVPTSVKVTDVEVATNSNFLEWNRAFLGSATAYGGILMMASSVVAVITRAVPGPLSRLQTAACSSYRPLPGTQSTGSTSL